MSPNELIAHGDFLFGKRGSLLSLWQETADQFYPERADFTASRSLGDEFASHLSSSYPCMVRRDLGNSFVTYMRNDSLDWFDMMIRGEEIEDQQGLAWLKWATGTQRRAMDDRRSLFARASKEADHDIAAFGQAVKSVEMNGNADGLLYRCWHLRDCAWCENAEGKVDTLHRKWKPTCAELVEIFEKRSSSAPGSYGCHDKVKEKLIGPNKSPYSPVNCRHIVMPAALFDGNYRGKGNRRVKYVSIFLDVDNKHVMEAVGMTYFMYIVPRWQTVSGSQYAYSPATVIALPDARLLQAMTYTLLEAGEKATNPPMLAAQDAIRGDINLLAGGVTWIDAEYNERTGEVLRPLNQDKSGIPVGFNMSDAIKIALGEAFFLSKLTLPVGRPEMTAFEVQQYVEQYIRDAAPIFGVLEAEDNGATCETTFELMMQAGAFGSYEDIPQSIRGKDITFQFESPLHKAIKRQKGNTFAEALGLVTQAMAIDQSAGSLVDFSTALRDTLTAIGTPPKWQRSEEDVAQIAADDAQKKQVAETIEAINAGATAAEQVGRADQALGPEALAA